MATNINFTNDLNDESDANISYNLPRKIYRDSLKRAVAAGATAEAESCTYNIMLDMDYERLLNRASLLVTPTLYKEGVLYPQIPTYNSNGDFSVTRATTATRVNAAGLVELVPYNLATWSEMFSNVLWVKNASTITDNTTTAPNGLLTADTITANGTSAAHLVSQVVTLNSGTSYAATFYVKKSTNDFVQIYSYNATGGQFANFDINSGAVGSVGTTFGSNPTSSITSIGNGWYRCAMVLSAAATAASGFGIAIVSSNSATRIETNSLSTSVFLWGAQLVEGTSALDYQMTETRLNIPRLDYSLGSCPNILLEPQRTNLILRSEEFDNAAWGRAAVSVTANSTTSPSGLVNADTLTADGTLSQHRLTQGANVTSGTTYSYSIYAKKNTNNFLQIYGLGSGFGANVWANFDLNNGVVGSVGTSTTASIQSVGNGWYRCIITGAATATILGEISPLICTSSTSLRAEINTLSTSVFLWGAQLEAGAYATSYIPTTSASVTRNADVVQKTGVSSLIGQTEGTLYSQLHIGASDSSSTARMIASISNGTPQNRIEIYRFNNTIQYDNIAGGVYQGVGSVATITNFNTTMKIAIKYSLNSVKFFINGVLVNTDTTALIPACSQINIGSSLGGGLQYGGFINSMALFPTPLTDGEMSMLTSGIYTPALAYAQLGLVSESPACLDSSVNALL
jgi:hypothetical protein